MKRLEVRTFEQTTSGLVRAEAFKRSLREDGVLSASVRLGGVTRTGQAVVVVEIGSGDWERCKEVMGF